MQLKQVRGRVPLLEFARIDNLLDHRYIASLFVNETIGRYYEPAAVRNFLIWASLAYAF